MPIYEYMCATCGNVDEHLMRVSDPSPEGCTRCGGPVSKLLSQTSFALKGDGWYVTDYKPKPKGAEVGAGTASDAGAGDGSAAAAKDAPAGGESVPAAASSPSEPVSSVAANDVKTGAGS